MDEQELSSTGAGLGVPVGPLMDVQTAADLARVLSPYADRLDSIREAVDVGPIDFDKFQTERRKHPELLQELLDELGRVQEPTRRLQERVKKLAAFEKSGGAFVVRSAEANRRGIPGIQSDKYLTLLKRFSKTDTD